MGGRVLVVEDDEDNRRIVEAALASAGYSVTGVADGKAALEACEAARPDVVVLDLGLPGLDGWETARRLKAGANPPPILALTAMALPGDEERARRAGCDDVLTKPCRAAELRDRVKRWAGA